MAPASALVITNMQWHHKTMWSRSVSAHQSNSTPSITNTTSTASSVHKAVSAIVKGVHFVIVLSTESSLPAVVHVPGPTSRRMASASARSHSSRGSTLRTVWHWSSVCVYRSMSRVSTIWLPRQRSARSVQATVHATTWAATSAKIAHTGR